MGSTESLLFTPVGQNGSVVWRKRVASPERTTLEAFVGFLQLNVNVQTIMRMNHVTVPREDSSLEALAGGGDDRVWRWKGLPS